jgi:CrcB protein
MESAAPGARARYAAVVLGGIVGGLLRYGQGAFFTAVLPGAFPWGTFTINVAGSLALCAFLAVLVESAGAHPLWRPFFAVGFCGTYTTFSSFENETLALVSSGREGVAALYVLASVLVGLGASAGGDRLLRHSRRLGARLALAPPLGRAPALTLAVTAVVVALVSRRASLAVPDLALGCGAVLAGGPLGAVARYAVGAQAAKHLGSAFPWGTFIINVTGSFLIGLFEGVAARHGGAPPVLRLLLVTGWCGGYTTFSTFAYETLVLAREGNRPRALANVLGSVAFGLGAAAAGVALGKTLG